MTTAEVLAYLESNVGKPLALFASPNYWACEDMGRAKGYEKPLEEVRKAYRAIRSGVDPLTVLTKLKKHIRGIENNAICRLIEKL